MKKKLLFQTLLFFAFVIFIFIFSYNILLRLSNVKNEQVSGQIDFSYVYKYKLSYSEEDITDYINQIDKTCEDHGLKCEKDTSILYFNKDGIFIYRYYKGDRENYKGLEITIDISNKSSDLEKLYKELKEKNFLDFERIYVNDFFMHDYKNVNQKNMQIEHNSEIIAIVYENLKYSFGLFEEAGSEAPYFTKGYYSGNIYIRRPKEEVKIHLESKKDITSKDFQWIINSVFPFK